MLEGNKKMRLSVKQIGVKGSVESEPLWQIAVLFL